MTRASKLLAGLLPAASLAVLAGCGSRANEPDLTTEAMATSGHGIAFNSRATGAISSVFDRSDSAQGGEIVTTFSNGIRTSVDVRVDDGMEGGTTTPGAGNLKVDPSATSTFRDGDTFLTRVDTGSSYMVNRYTVRRDNLQHVFYSSGGNKTGNMPTGGSATYRGEAAATVFGSATQSAEVTGNVRIDAQFAPGGGTIQGRISRLDGPLAGTDLLLNQRSIVGSNFQNGEMSLVAAGTVAPNANMTGSDYQGAFFGNDASEIAGTFQFGAQNVPMAGGGTQSVEGVGAFGASR